MMSKEQTATPFPRSYWVVPGKLLAGFYPGAQEPGEAAQKLQGLFDCGVRCIVNLMEADEKGYDGQIFTPYDDHFRQIAAARGAPVECVRILIRDVDIPTRATMRTILDTIDGTIARGLPVYVHCWGGIGRTGTVVGCYLARHGMAVGDEALGRIRELRRADAKAYKTSPETEEQRAFVRSWPEGE